MLLILFLASTALLFGGYFATCEVFGIYEFLLKDQGGLSYIVFAGSGIAAAVSLLPAWASFAGFRRPVLSLMLWLLFAASLGTVVAAALGRTGTYTDVAQEHRDKAADIRKDASKAEDDAENAVTKAEQALAAARADAAAKAPLKTCASNCAALLTAAIASADAELQMARGRLDTARSKRMAAPPEKKDSLSIRIAAVFPSITEAQVRLYQPIAVPALTSALSAVLVALGFWGLGRAFPSLGKRKPEPAPDGRKGLFAKLFRRRPKLISPSAIAAPEPPLAPAASAVPALPIAAVAEQPPTLPRPTVPLQIVGPGSKLAAFAAMRIKRDSTAETHMRDARLAYEDFCAAATEPPLDLPAFVRELASLCKVTGIGVRVDGKDVFLVGARLAA